MEQIVTKTFVDTSFMRIWKILTDFSSYPEWNPLVREALGIKRRGNRLTLRVAHSQNSTMVYRPYIVEIEWGQRLVLQGNVFRFSGSIRAEHFLLIERISSYESVQLTQRHVFHGTAASVGWNRFAPPLYERIQKMNEALKKRAESARNETTVSTESDRRVGASSINHSEPTLSSIRAPKQWPFPPKRT
jgi:hypothetical protein